MRFIVGTFDAEGVIGAAINWTVFALTNNP